MRRELQLPIDDTKFLNSLNLQWESIRDVNQGNAVIMHDIDLPEGYNIDRAAVLFKLDATYPDTHIDMVYFYPWLYRKDGKTIPNADQNLIFDGKTWQRWSRHRTPQNPWRIGLDNISTHMCLVRWWLERELNK